MDYTTMAKLPHPLLLLVARATEKELVRMVEYLKAENRTLRTKLPKRIEVTPAERWKLVKLGKPLGSKIKELITIVCVGPGSLSLRRFFVTRKTSAV